MNKYQPAAYGDAMVRGQLRQWKERVAIKYRMFETCYNSDVMFEVGTDFACRSSEKGRLRAFAKLRQAFGPGAHLENFKNQKRPLAIWSILEPRESILATESLDKPGLQQNCVVINYILAGHIPDYDGQGRRFLTTGLWTLELPDHALGRLIHRSGLLPDAAVREAHENLLGLPTREAKMTNHYQDLEENSFLVKAGPGAFICNLGIGRDGPSGEFVAHVRAQTWISSEMVGPRQRVLSEPGKPGKRLGDGWLRPRALCKIEVEDDGSVSCSPI
jgi:hypothetical protein